MNLVYDNMLCCCLHQKITWSSARNMFTSTKPLWFREDYDKLEIKKNASRKEIKAAYFQKAKELHPDSRHIKNMDLQFQFYELNEAYQRLMTEAAFGGNSYDYSKNDSQKRTMDQRGWYAGPDSRQSYFSNTRVFLRKVNMAFKCLVLLFFGCVIIKQFLVRNGLL